VIAEVEEIVDEIDPNFVHTPGVYVDYIVQSDFEKKPLEIIANSSETGELLIQGKFSHTREKIAKRVAKEVKNGEILNLGVGIPTLVPNYVDHHIDFEVHSENGILGVDSYPLLGKEDPDLINAGKESVTINNRASFFSSSDSFGMIRGGHLAMTVLGAMEISHNGDIANWIIPGKMVKGMGGAMDLVNCSSKVIVAMEHCTKNGKPKIKEECSLPLTGKSSVSLVVTELAVFDFFNGRIRLLELADGVTLEEVKAKTECEFLLADTIGRF